MKENVYELIDKTLDSKIVFIITHDKEINDVANKTIVF